MTAAPQPWDKAEIEEFEIAAVQAVARGKASSDQQRRCMWVLIQRLCRADAASFWPGGEEGRRASDFAEGKRYVGIELRRLLTVVIGGKPGDRRPLAHYQLQEGGAENAASDGEISDVAQ